MGGQVEATIDGTWTVGEYFIQLDFKDADGKPDQAPNDGYAAIEITSAMADPP